MSSSIGPVAQLVKIIRSQLATRAAPGGAGTAAVKKPVSSFKGERRTAEPYAEKNLGALIELRVAQIGREDPQRGRKAFRVFLEAVLLSQLGEGLIKDPRFFQLVDDVQLAMEADEACGALVARAIEHLLAGK